MSIEALKAEQARLGLRHVHLVHLAEESFTVAHTDDERAAPESLEGCALHVWLMGLDGPPSETGVWVAVPHQPDALQEPYRADPWDFEPIELYTASRADA